MPGTALLPIRKAVGAFARMISPGYSACERCGMPWSVVNGHTTMYTEGRGCFPLCEHCWKALAPEERLPFYKSLWDDWMAQGCDHTEWEPIEKAVLNGG